MAMPKTPSEIGAAVDRDAVSEKLRREKELRGYIDVMVSCAKSVTPDHLISEKFDLPRTTFDVRVKKDDGLIEGFGITTPPTPFVFKADEVYLNTKEGNIVCQPLVSTPKLSINDQPEIVPEWGTW